MILFFSENKNTQYKRDTLSMHFENRICTRMHTIAKFLKPLVFNYS